MKNPLNSLVGVLVLTSLSAITHASVIVLDFEGVGDFSRVLDFYNGGTDSQGNSGINYGVSFSSEASGLVDVDAGGFVGNFANEPSPSTVMVPFPPNAFLNFAAGFDTGFSFYYSSLFSANVSIYDDLYGSGNLLGTIAITAQSGDNCVGDPNGTLCNWTPAGVNFAGIAKSIQFVGSFGQVGYDDITLGSATPGRTPVPATLGLVVLGLAGIGWSNRKKT